MHNGTPWCKTLEKWLDKPAELLTKAKALGLESRIHAHHIVMRNPQKYFDKETVDALNESKRILKDAGIELFDISADDFKNRATADNIQNLAWAINNFNDIHQEKYVMAVYEKLKAVDGAGRAKVAEVLAKIREDLQNNVDFWNH